MNFYKAELKLISRTTTVRWLLLFYVAAGITSAFFGRAWLAQQQQNQQLAVTHYQQQLERFQHAEHPMDPGLIAYYLAAPAELPASPWAALISGLRDEQRVQSTLRLLAVQGQLYAGELHNYEQQRLGRLDLAFVWLYLLPLLIGVLCINVIADDKAGGRWGFIAAQAKSEAAIIFARLALRFVVLLAANSALLFGASLIAGTGFGAVWWSVFGLLLLYQTIWFLAAAIIIAWNKAPATNVLAFLALWLLWVFAAPGAAYLSQMNAQQINDGARLVIEQRQLMNDSWDHDKQAALQAFLQKHPEWADTHPITGRFAWHWYYAMQQTSDEAVAEVASRYSRAYSSLAERVSGWRWLSPTLHLQFTLTRLADTDEIAYQNYVQQLVNWHAQMRQFWYPYFFFEREFSPADLNQLPKFDYIPAPPPVAEPILPLLFWALLLAGGLYGGGKIKRYRKTAHGGRAMHAFS